MVTLTIPELRQFYVTWQGLHTGIAASTGAVTNHVQKVGCIQYDPLDVVGRNADLVLQARFENYRPEILSDALYTRRTLVDGWDKVMSIYTAADWAHMSRVRRQRGSDTNRYLEYRGALEVLQHIEDVYNILNEQGPLSPAALDLGTVPHSTWGHGKIASAAMDYLFHFGRVGVAGKNGVQRIYDIMERLLPEASAQPDPFPSHGDFMDWYVKRRIGSFGIYWNRSGDGWLGVHLGKSAARTAAISRLLKSGELIEVKVAGLKDKFYAVREALPVLGALKPPPENTLFIGPLDNLIWDRKLITAVYGFDYKWEVYKPEKLREYGYYVLPVLCGDRFVARVEFHNYRGGSLRVKHWWWEGDVAVTDALLSSVQQGLNRFCAYLGAPKWDRRCLKSIAINR